MPRDQSGDRTIDACKWRTSQFGFAKMKLLAAMPLRFLTSNQHATIGYQA
jgi:hypothetical protein